MPDFKGDAQTIAESVFLPHLNGLCEVSNDGRWSSRKEGLSPGIGFLVTCYIFGIKVRSSDPASLNPEGILALQT